MEARRLTDWAFAACMSIFPTWGAEKRNETRIWRLSLLGTMYLSQVVEVGRFQCNAKALRGGSLAWAAQNCNTNRGWSESVRCLDLGKYERSE